MKNKSIRLCVIAILLLSSPFIYTELQGYLTIYFAFPLKTAIGAKSFTSLSSVFIASGMIGAAITSVVVAFPTSYLGWKYKRAIFAIFLVITQVLPVYSFFDQPEVKAFTAIVFTGELIAFAVFALIFVNMGSRLGQKHDEVEV